MTDAPSRAPVTTKSRSLPMPVVELIRRRVHLPFVDPEALRRDVDAAVGGS